MRYRLLLAAVLSGLVLATGARAGELRFVSSAELNTLDPQKMSWLQDIRIAQCLFEPLVVYRLPAGTVEGGAASSWDISPDQATYTFHLRPGAHWSNGDPVTAHDFIYAWRRAMLPDLASDYSYLLFRIRGAQAFFDWRNKQLEAYASAQDHSPAAAQALWDRARRHFARTVGLEAPNPLTLVVHLEHPTPYFLELAAFCTFMPVDPASIARFISINPDTGMLQQDPLWTRPGNLVSNGPYVLDRWRFKRDIHLAVNPTYWDRAAVKNDGITQLTISEVLLSLIDYHRGDVQWLPDLPSTSPTVADLANAGRSDVHKVPMAGTYFYNFNCAPTLANGRRNPLADPRVRRALALTIDRRIIVTKITRLNQPIAYTFIPPGVIPGYSPPLPPQPANPVAEARKLLAEAGYPGGRNLTGLSILYNTEGGHLAIAQTIQANWHQALGVSVTLEGVEPRMFSQRLRQHNFTISRAAWIGDYRDPTTFLDKFITGNGNNDAQYSNPAFDALMHQAELQPDQARRMAILEKAEALMLADQPIAPIFHYVFVEMYDPRKVQGLESGPWNIHRLEFVSVK